MSPPTAQQLGALIRPLHCNCSDSTCTLTYHKDGILELDCRLCGAHEETDAGFLCLSAEESGLEFNGVDPVLRPTDRHCATAIGESTEIIVPPVADHHDLPDAAGPSWWAIIDLLLIVFIVAAVAIGVAWRLL